MAAASQLLNVFVRSEAQVEQRAARWLRSAIGNSVVIGIFGLLTLLHLAFFGYYPAQRANLYFAFSALALAFSSLLWVNPSQLPHIWWPADPNRAGRV